MAQQKEKRPPPEEQAPVVAPPFSFANSIIANCLIGNAFESAFANRGPGILTAAFTSLVGLSGGIAAKSARFNNSFHTKIEHSNPLHDDMHSYSSFTSTISSSDNLSSSGLSTPSTMMGDYSTSSSYFSSSTQYTSPYTPSCDAGSFRDPAPVMGDMDDSGNDYEIYGDSDCEFADVESDEESDDGPTGCADDSDDEMEYQNSEDGDSVSGDEEDGMYLIPKTWPTNLVSLTYTACPIEEQLSFISFERSVHFSCAEDEIIPSSEPETPLPDAFPEMTCHERMLLAEHMKNRRIGNWENGGDYDPEEHSPDSLQLDKDLLFAYVNGLRTLNQNCCMIALKSRTLNASKDGSIKVDTRIGKDVNDYLDRIADLLRGIFPNLFTADEYAGILNQAQAAVSFDDYGQLIYEAQSVNVQHTIRGFLAERLGCHDMFLQDEMLEWFAGNLIAPLGRQALSRHTQPSE
ncbi:hypothetical protein LOZ58_000216 [Ophidiomyces ophidiicola]|nr:hypothetical protein LOZ58_000216 [Ophidiomyces ophidiicola]